MRRERRAKRDGGRLLDVSAEVRFVFGQFGRTIKCWGRKDLASWDVATFIGDEPGEMWVCRTPSQVALLTTQTRWGQSLSRSLSRSLSVSRSLARALSRAHFLSFSLSLSLSSSLEDSTTVD